MQPRLVVLVRHARAGQAASDAERPLTDEGLRSAEATGDWLLGQGVHPDRALVSAARRAEETWAALARGAGWSLEPDLTTALYSAEPETALDLLREAGEAATVVLVGHNPTIGTMAQLLDDGEGDTAAGEAMAAEGFSPGAVALLEHAGAWSDLTWGAGRLVGYRSGR